MAPFGVTALSPYSPLGEVGPNSKNRHTHIHVNYNHDKGSQGGHMGLRVHNIKIISNQRRLPGGGDMRMNI